MDRIETFFQALAEASERLLMLDYDGTVAPFRRDRDRAHPYPGVHEALADLRADPRTRLVLVSGRPATEVRRLLGLEPSPEIFGCHGWERVRLGGESAPVTLPPPAEKALTEAWQWLVTAGLDPMAEKKAAGLAVHWRGTGPEEARRIEQRVRQGWRPWLAAGGVELLEFAAGLELRALGRDKGWVVRDLLGEMGSDCVAAYLGDDITDEDAFAALGGRGVGILVRSAPRPSQARFWLRPPEELLDFLIRWAKMAG